VLEGIDVDIIDQLGGEDDHKQDEEEPGDGQLADGGEEGVLIWLLFHHLLSGL
jgi:hypothetical protein